MAVIFEEDIEFLECLQGETEIASVQEASSFVGKDDTEDEQQIGKDEDEKIIHENTWREERIELREKRGKETVYYGEMETDRSRKEREDILVCEGRRGYGVEERIEGPDCIDSGAEVGKEKVPIHEWEGESGRGDKADKGVSVIVLRYSFSVHL